MAKLILLIVGFLGGVFFMVAMAPDQDSGRAAASGLVPKGAAPSEAPELEVSNVGVSLLDQLLDEQRYSWKATVANLTNQPQKVTAILRLYDAQGFELDQDLHVGIHLAARERREVSKASIIKKALIDRAVKTEVTAEFR